MALKDISFDLLLAHTDGLANLVDRFQVDGLRTTRERYEYEPYLREHVRPEHGWIDVWPAFVCARLLSLGLGNMRDQDAIDKIKTLSQTVIRFIKSSQCEPLRLKFSGVLEEGSEGSGSGSYTIWKIRSKPSQQIATLRGQVRQVASTLGFVVQPLIESDSEVHIVIRGRWNNSRVLPQVPRELTPLPVTCDKVGFRRRYEWGASAKPCGELFLVNFVRAPSDVALAGSRKPDFQADLADRTKWPEPVHDKACKPRSWHNTLPKPPLLELHASTTFPLEDDVDVGVAASLVEADRAALQHRTPTLADILRQQVESVVLLEMSRDPAAYHDKLRNGKELQFIRDRLLASGKSFILKSGGYAFVRPEQYEPAMKALEFHHQRHRGAATPHHVLVAQEYEKDVESAIQSLPIKQCNGMRVKQKRSTKLALASASQCTSSDTPIEVTRTFLEFKVQSSLRSMPSKTCAASTTDAHGFPNPRRA